MTLLKIIPLMIIGFAALQTFADSAQKVCNAYAHNADGELRSLTGLNIENCKSGSKATLDGKSFEITAVGDVYFRAFEQKTSVTIPKLPGPQSGDVIYCNGTATGADGKIYNLRNIAGDSCKPDAAFSDESKSSSKLIVGDRYYEQPNRKLAYEQQDKRGARTVCKGVAEKMEDHELYEFFNVSSDSCKLGQKFDFKGTTYQWTGVSSAYQTNEGQPSMLRLWGSTNDPVYQKILKAKEKTPAVR